MSELPTPDEVEEATARGNMVAGLVRSHYESLKGTGFEDDEAFELAQAYHWNLITGGRGDEE